MASNGLMVQPSGILPMDNDFQKMLRMAAEFAQSGILAKGIPPKAAAVLLVVQQGYELGIPPAAALANISIVEGKPTLDAKMHRALIYRDHGDEAFRFVETSATRCVIEYKRRGWSEPSRFTLTIEEIPEGLRRKDNWRNYPANMLRARATTFVSVMAFSDTTNGLYTPEELGAEVEIGADGEPVMIARTVDAEGEADEQPEAVRLPFGLRPEQWANLHSMATAKGVDIDPLMTPDQIAGAIRKAGGAAIPGAITPRAIKDALDALQVHQAPSDQYDYAVARQATEDDPYAEIAAATDAGRTLPLVKD